MTHISAGHLTIIGSDNGLSPGRRQAIIWTNAGILLIWLLGTNFSEILIEIHILPFKKMHLKMSSGKWRPFCLGLNVLTRSGAICRQPSQSSSLADEPIMAYCQLDPYIQTPLKVESKHHSYHSWKCISRISSAKWCPFYIWLIKHEYEWNLKLPSSFPKWKQYSGSKFYLFCIHK